MLQPSVVGDFFIENIFEDFFDEAFWKSTGVRSVDAMRTDIRELQDAYEIDMELPGFSGEDVRAELKNGYLTVRAARSASVESEGTYICKERYNGHYQRSFFVGKNVSQEDVTAKFKDGILTLRIPKKERQLRVEAMKYIPIAEVPQKEES